MSKRILAMIVGTAACLCWPNEPLHAQRRNLFEDLGRTLLNEVVNGNQRQQRPSAPPPKTTQPQLRQMQMPDESGKTPGRDPYGGIWQNIIQPQPQPRPQPRVTPQPRVQPRRYPLNNRQTYPPGSQQFDTYHYPPQSSRSQPYQNPSSQSQPAPQVYYPPQASSTGPIKIRFPKTQSGTCAFAIVSGTAEYPRNMNPGEMQRLEGTSAWKVRIKNSGTSDTYHLTPGSEYVFLRDSGNSLKLFKQMAPNVSTRQ